MCTFGESLFTIVVLFVIFEVFITQARYDARHIIHRTPSDRVWKWNFVCGRILHSPYI